MCDRVNKSSFDYIIVVSPCHTLGAFVHFNLCRWFIGPSLSLSFFVSLVSLYRCLLSFFSRKLRGNFRKKKKLRKHICTCEKCVFYYLLLMSFKFLFLLSFICALASSCSSTQFQAFFKCQTNVFSALLRSALIFLFRMCTLHTQFDTRSFSPETAKHACLIHKNSKREFRHFVVF